LEPVEEGREADVVVEEGFGGDGLGVEELAEEGGGVLVQWEIGREL